MKHLTSKTLLTAALVAMLALLPACRSTTVEAGQETMQATSTPSSVQSGITATAQPEQTQVPETDAPQVSDYAETLLEAQVTGMDALTPNCDLLNLIALSDIAGDYTLVQEEQEILVHFANVPSNITLANKDMAIASRLLLALITPCERVQWRYGEELHLYGWDATDELKAQGESAEGVQALLDSTGLEINTTRLEEPEADAAMLGLHTLDVEGDSNYIPDYVEVTGVSGSEITFTYCQSGVAQYDAITAAWNGSSAEFATAGLSGALFFADGALTLTITASDNELVPAGDYAALTHWMPVERAITTGALIFSFPEEFQSQVYYSVYEWEEETYYQFNQIASLKTIGGGTLFTVGMSPSEAYLEQPSFETLTTISDVHYFVLYPTDVQFDVSDPAVQEAYDALVSVADTSLHHYITTD